MEEKFVNGEIRSLHDFIRHLKTNNNDKARLKILREHTLFERAINFCLTEAEANLKSRNLIDILKDFVKENPIGYEFRAIKRRIDNSGHKNLITAFYE